LAQAISRQTQNSTVGASLQTTHQDLHCPLRRMIGSGYVSPLGSTSYGLGAPLTTTTTYGTVPTSGYLGASSYGYASPSYGSYSGTAPLGSSSYVAPVTTGSLSYAQPMMSSSYISPASSTAMPVSTYVGQPMRSSTYSNYSPSYTATSSYAEPVRTYQGLSSVSQPLGGYSIPSSSYVEPVRRSYTSSSPVATSAQPIRTVTSVAAPVTMSAGSFSGTYGSSVRAAPASSALSATRSKPPLQTERRPASMESMRPYRSRQDHPVTVTEMENTYPGGATYTNSTFNTGGYSSSINMGSPTMTTRSLATGPLLPATGNYSAGYTATSAARPLYSGTWSQGGSYVPPMSRPLASDRYMPSTTTSLAPPTSGQFAGFASGRPIGSSTLIPPSGIMGSMPRMPDTYSSLPPSTTSIYGGYGSPTRTYNNLYL